MTTKVSVYDYPGFVSVELPYNLPQVNTAIGLLKKGQKPLTLEQLNGNIVNLLTPGLRIACDHARKLPPPGLNVKLTMVGGTYPLLDLVAYIVTRQGLRYTIGNSLQLLQRSKPTIFHSVWS